MDEQLQPIRIVPKIWVSRGLHKFILNSVQIFAYTYIDIIIL